MIEVIILDIDDTVVDTIKRVRAVLTELGYKVANAGREELNSIVEGLDILDKSKFFKLFLSDKYTHLDSYNEHVIDHVVSVQLQTDLPVVIITGRPVGMTSTEQVIAYLRKRGIKILDVITRESATDLRHSKNFKLTALQLKEYIPAYIYDDDHDVLDAVSDIYPNAILIDPFSIRGAHFEHSVFDSDEALESIENF